MREGEYRRTFSNAPAAAQMMESGSIRLPLLPAPVAHARTRCTTYMDAKFQVGSSSPQLTSKVHFPTPGHSTTKLTRSRLSSPGKHRPARRVLVPRATTREGAWGTRPGTCEESRLAPGGAGARRLLPPHASPAPRPASPPSGQAAPGSWPRSRRRRGPALPRRLPEQCAHRA